MMLPIRRWLGGGQIQGARLATSIDVLVLEGNQTREHVQIQSAWAETDRSEARNMCMINIKRLDIYKSSLG